jgi:hypothetical protein
LSTKLIENFDSAFQRAIAGIPTPTSPVMKTTKMDEEEEEGEGKGKEQPSSLLTTTYSRRTDERLTVRVVSECCPRFVALVIRVTRCRCRQRFNPHQDNTDKEDAGDEEEGQLFADNKENSGAAGAVALYVTVRVVLLIALFMHVYFSLCTLACLSWTDLAATKVVDRSPTKCLFPDRRFS